MSDSPDMDGMRQRHEWLANLSSKIEQTEKLWPFDGPLADDGNPQWVNNISRELAVVMLPSAKLRGATITMTPRRMGAMIGHACSLAVWLQELLKQNSQQLCPEKLSHSAENPSNEAKDFLIWYDSMRRLAKHSLCSCVDQPFEDMSEFLRGYSDGFAGKPKSFNLVSLGNTSTEIYFLMFMFWRLVAGFDSVRVLHEWLRRCVGYRVGDMKRIEKICQRMGLSYRKPGRPKKLRQAS